MRKIHRQLFICSILGIFVCILVVEKTIVADICSLLVCSYFAPKILGVFFYFLCVYFAILLFVLKLTKTKIQNSSHWA